MVNSICLALRIGPVASHLASGILVTLFLVPSVFSTTTILCSEFTK
uniref:Uncharacterized protein n=1 Tax=Anguilla anguilla TaxID=7936 RepID=A0A0E9VX40_ANGAN